MTDLNAGGAGIQRQDGTPTSADEESSGAEASTPSPGAGVPAARRRRRGSRGGKRRTTNREANKSGDAGEDDASPAGDTSLGADSRPDSDGLARWRATDATSSGAGSTDSESTDSESTDADAAEKRPWTIKPLGSIPPPPGRPKVGDSRPAPAAQVDKPASNRPGRRRSVPGDVEAVQAEAAPERARRRRKAGRGGGGAGAAAAAQSSGVQPIRAVLSDAPVELDEDTLEKRRGRERKGRPVGRYTMVVHSSGDVTQVAVLEGRSLIEHYVSRPADDANQIDGNIYLGRVQNVLPGMEAAFVDIGTPKNAVLYRGDVRYDRDDIESSSPGTPDGSEAGPTRGKLPGAARNARIEQLLKNGQTVLCQVVKNPIGTKGARLSQEVSLPGRFVVLIPGSDTYGISKRLGDEERKRLRRILDDIRPAGHGLIVRTAAEGATADELRRDVLRLAGQWERIERLAAGSRAPTLLYREPSMAVRVIREEFNKDYRSVVIDDQSIFEEIKEYVASVNPELADRIEWAGASGDPLPVFERHHVHEQVHKALDRKVWLPSGGSLIIERTEALTVIDVNTGKNVGTSNLEQTVFANNLEAAEEIARQLRLRDIGGIIVIDFIDMEVAPNRAEVMRTFRAALARDKTRTQVFDISELGLVEMTRKRISEGLIEALSETCPTCGGRGIVFDQSLL